MRSYHPYRILELHIKDNITMSCVPKDDHLKPIVDIHEEFVQNVGRLAVDHYNNTTKRETKVKFKRVVNGLSGGVIFSFSGVLFELVVEVEEDEFNSSYIAKVKARQFSLREFVPISYEFISFEPVLTYKK